MLAMTQFECAFWDPDGYITKFILMMFLGIGTLNLPGPLCTVPERRMIDESSGFSFFNLKTEAQGSKSFIRPTSLKLHSEKELGRH